MTDVRSVDSCETVVSSEETIPYDNEDGIPLERSASAASTISIESYEDDAETIAELFAHHYIPDV